MAKINPYLNFNGDTEAAFNFYKSVFGGEFITLQRFKDIPDLPGGEMMSEKEKEGIMHVALPIGDNILMATDVLPSLGHPMAAGNNISISIDTASREEADTLFNKLSDGGKIDMPLQVMFWGAYYGMCTDKFGIQWMVNQDEKQDGLLGIDLK